MATNYITVKGVIENGELKVDLPENVQDGEVEVTIARREVRAIAYRRYISNRYRS